jgi:serine/threonine protein kinase
MMTPEHWQEVKRMLAGALERPPSERRAYLDQVCTEPEVRREVDSLIAAHDQAEENFMERAQGNAAPSAQASASKDALKSGAMLGPYEIIGAIGAGGMGEVYRARDTKLGRDVAIKVLPPAFVKDPERLARFRREARIVASLNHPNIATIHGLEETGGVHALVMELVEGPTLADRIKRGAIPLDEALPIAEQIAQAVEYAHERGIIHRDLKPANIKLTSSDAVKVLDFGLAKALDPETSQADISNSPTITQMATQSGIILGTAAYMSPEQAKGKPLDRRTDIWAFGCVFYEMLTAKAPFRGETITETLAAVIREEPDWTLLPRNTPPAIRGLLTRCMTKDSRQRLRDIGEARIAIEDVISGAPEQTQLDLPIAPQSRVNRAWLAMSLVGILAIIAAGLGVWIALRPPAEELPFVLAYIPPPPGTSFRDVGFSVGYVTVSPDGKQLAFTAIDQNGVTKLWVRPLGSNQATAIAGTEDAAGPFWSPDSRSLGFFTGDKLKTVDLGDGSIQVLTDSTCDFRGAWSKAGTILFTRDCHGPLNEISASGGNPQPATTLEDSGLRQEEPAFLPDGRHFLYTALDENHDTSIWAASLDSSEKKLVLKDAGFPEFISGYLLYVSGLNHVLAQPFDISTETLTGKPVPLVESPGFSVSQNGVFAYQGGSLDGQPVWFDHNGISAGAIGQVATYWAVKFSPDGKSVLTDVEDTESGAHDQWSFPTSGGMGTRLTFGPGEKDWSAWSPDGKYIAYSCTADGKPAVCRKPADGSGAEEVIFTFAGDVSVPDAGDWSPDGRYLSLDGYNPHDSRPEVWALPLFGDRKLFQPAPSTAYEYGGQFSPDGHWLSYFSYETGRPEVYVVPFPGPGGKYQISQGGGWLDRWDKKNHLYFLTLGNRLMQADLDESEKSLRVKAIEPLFQVNVQSFHRAPIFDVTPDGSRFIVISAADPTASNSITVLLNWQTALKADQQQ